MSVANAQHSLLELKGVGPSLLEKLSRLGLSTAQDLLFHLPLRYQDRTRISPIGSVRAGMETTLRGEIQLTEVKYARRRMLLTRITDGTGFITLRFFHFSASQQTQLARGIRIQCFGEIRGSGQSLEMVHPEYRLLGKDETHHLEQALTPFYPMTEGLSQPRLRYLVSQLLNKQSWLDDILIEYLPAEILQRMPALQESVKYVHQPPLDADQVLLQEGRHPVQRRLAFEELLAQQLSLKQLRARQAQHAAPALQGAGALAEALRGSLPFALTAAQQRVVADIGRDLQRRIPMQRLLQGDVGSGKTVVAALAACQAVEAGVQVAVMAPTELLAEQHRANFHQWLIPLGIEVAWLSGKLRSQQRRDSLAAIADGSAQVVVGTQALFQEGVAFHKLGLVVIDEQHRFGVHQRLALREKGNVSNSTAAIYPHQLVMTATPIPRTLAQAAYADMDVSILDELPPGRTPVDTVIISEQRRDEVVARMHQACRDGKQAYWVCPLVEESETLQCQAAEATFEALQAALPDLRIGLVHGRLKSKQKEQVMQAFKRGELNLLVATTVIEVGVDVPNASLMIIDNAERLGLSQLHQLRGRVGRGAEQSRCVLLYSAAMSKTAKQRLSILRETNDGFVVAQRDLEIRGPGELLGTRQTGLVNLRIADFQRDQDMLPRIAQCAELILHKYPHHVEPLIRRWLGDGLRYREV